MNAGGGSHLASRQCGAHGGVGENVKPSAVIIVSPVAR